MNDVSLIILPLLFVFIIGYGMVKKVAVYEEFLLGAKQGFDMAVQIMPNLIAILFAVAIFRESGLLEFLAHNLAGFFEYLGMSGDLLNMALLRPLTGSGSVAILADLIEQHGQDSLTVKAAAILFGSTETTFYVIAVYFGAIAIRNIRYALYAGLIADLAGFLLPLWLPGGILADKSRTGVLPCHNLFFTLKTTTGRIKSGN